MYLLVQTLKKYLDLCGAIEPLELLKGALLSSGVYIINYKVFHVNLWESIVS
jgi:hypothetical protein